MKLNELFDVEPARELEKDNAETLGKGTFANVNQSKSDPHMVNRILSDKAKANLFKEDGFETYASHIIEIGINKDNPTFPRIYKKSNGEYQIEKLVNLSSVSRDELFNYLLNNFNINEEDFYSTQKENLINELVYFIAEALEENNTASIRNDSIKDACRWISKLSRITGKNIDIHSGNIMFRRTSVGLPLVITDPLF